MGMCKECGVVFSVLKMENGICENCRNPDTKELQQKYKDDLHASKQLFTVEERARILTSHTYEHELFDTLKYLGGIEDIDNLVPNSGRKYLGLEIHGHHKGISIKIGITDIYLVLPADKVTSWTIELEEDILHKEEKSVVGRALLGGVLLGPLGAIIGGMTGLGDKTVTTESVNNVLTLCCNIQGKDRVLLFSMKKKSTMLIHDFFMDKFPESYKEPDNLQFENQLTEAKPTNISYTNISIADEIKKFKDLMDEGILTEEEFIAQKQKLLNI